jgi:purine-nucleoside phosphorylase
MKRMGILAVEMEAAGLYGVAAEFGAKALAVATVSDVIEKNLQMSSEEREVGLKTMVEITLDSVE